MEKIKVSEIRKELTWKFGKNRISVLADKDNLIITVSQKTFLATIPICNIVEKIIGDTELSVTEAGSAFILTYNNEQKSLSIKDDKVYLLNTTDDSGIQIEIV